jgi:transcriptional regulator with XRE-family HTH domain
MAKQIEKPTSTKLKAANRVEAISVAHIAQLIRDDAAQRLGKHVTTRDMSELTSISRSTWSNLMNAQSGKPEVKTFMLLADYLATLDPPLQDTDGNVYDQDWESLMQLDAAAREQQGLTKAEAIEELRRCLKRIEALTKIIAEN